MKVFRDGKHVKTIPKEYADVVDDFNFTCSKKRLQPEERFGLIQLKIIKRFTYETPPICAQSRFAANCVDMHTGDVDIICVNKRTHSQWRIRANGTEINVSSDLVSDCPNEFVERKNEF